MQMLLLVLYQIDKINHLHLYFVHNSGAGNIDLDDFLEHVSLWSSEAGSMVKSSQDGFSQNDHNFSI